MSMTPDASPAPGQRSVQDMLARWPWFQNLAAPHQERLTRACFHRDIAADGFACRANEPVEHWIGVIEGLARISVMKEDGRSAGLAGVPSGGWFGEGSLLKDEPRRYDVICLRDSRIIYMPAETFHWLRNTSFVFADFLMNQLNERLGQMIATIEHQRLLDPEGRLAGCLASMYHPQLYPDADHNLGLSQTELGLLTGLSRQRVNQALRKLEDAGLVTVAYGSVRVESLEGLRAFSGIAEK